VFRRTQRLYDAVYSHMDYAADCARLHDLIQHRRPGARTLLDVACGTGKHLERLMEHYDVEGVDLDPKMLEVAGERVGEGVPLHAGDMMTFDLGRTFDVVTCLFSSIAYSRTEEGLRQAVANLARHTRGLVIVEPWILPEAWIEGHLHADFVDQPDLKVGRITLSGPATETLTLTFHYLVGTPEGVEHFTENHEVGMFRHEQYLDAFQGAGLESEHVPGGLAGRGLYLGRVPD
jgi:SAM-dependent methyltransferase